MKALSDFYDWLLPELPGCATALVDMHLMAIAREYCTETRCWRTELAPIELPASSDSAILMAPESKVAVVAPLSLTVGGSLWWAALDGELATQPRFAAHRPPFTIAGDIITFTTRPLSQAVLTAAVAPSMRATQLPDLLHTEHLPAIRAGVLARLKAMGGKPWTDITMAAVHDEDYTAEKNLGGVRAARGNTGALLRTSQARI